MNIPLHLLQCLTVFADEKNILATAKKLKTTQPTITRQLRQIQDYFQDPLFEQRGRNKKLTPYAEALALKLSSRFQDLENLIHEVDIEQNSKQNLRVTIAGRSEILKKYFASKNFPGCMELEPMNSQQTNNAIQKATIDIGITQDEVITSSYIRKKLFSNSYYLAVPTEFLKKNRKISDWSEIYQDYAFCTYQSESPIIKRSLSFLNLSKPPIEQFKFADWQVLEERIYQGLNWGILPSSFLRETDNYKIQKIDPADEQQFYLYYRKSLARNNWFKDLLAE